MKLNKQVTKNLILIWTIGLIVLVGSVMTVFAQNYKKGDEVIIDIYGDGREVCNGIVEEVYKYSSGTTYSVKWDCGSGYSASNTGSVPANRLTPRGGAKKPSVPNVNSNPTPTKPVRKPVVRNDDDSKSEVSTDDLDWFFGKWKLSRYGGGSEVERSGKIYRETLMYVAKAAPITINSNGTYSWIVRDGTTLKGKWRKLEPKEDYINAGKNGLVLLDGFDKVDWQVSYMKTANGKESIKIFSHLGNFDGERMGANKGEPAWNKVQFSAGDSVIVTVPDGEQCNGTVDKPYRSYDGILTYTVYYTCQGSFKTSGNFPANKIRRR